MKFLLQWIDLAWLALALPVARRDQRVWVFGFFIGSMVMMRLLSELMESIGYPAGIMGFWVTPVFTRGLLVYSVFYMIYIMLIYFSPNAQGTMLMAASLGLFFLAFFTFALLMVI